MSEAPDPAAVGAVREADAIADAEGVDPLDMTDEQLELELYLDSVYGGPTVSGDQLGVMTGELENTPVEGEAEATVGEPKVHAFHATWLQLSDRRGQILAISEGGYVLAPDGVTRLAQSDDPLARAFGRMLQDQHAAGYTDAVRRGRR